MNATRQAPTQQPRTRSGQQQQRQNGQANGQPKGPFAELKRFPLKAVVWENQTANGSMFSVQLVRVYKGDSDQWQETHSMNADDLLAAGKILNDADTLIQDQLTERRRQQSDSNRG
jgi:hypothetical protein